uniref:Uncharacterized protein n=1 Tax=Lotus japonicus TaxID=34305 RepID=I3SU30_LOTJA|nr:unknown [Lotus japonicus]
MCHCLFLRSNRPSPSHTSFVVIAPLRSCLLAKTKIILLSINGSFMIVRNSCFAFPILSRSRLSTT